MIQNVYSIKDAKSNTFANPFYSVNHNTAIRSFNQAAADPNTTISQYPEDFSLYHLGTYNDENGKLEAEVTPQFVANPTINVKTENE
jgi:hypothetical protein